MNTGSTNSDKSPRPVRVLVNALHSKTGGGLTYLNNVLPLLAEDPSVDLHICIHESQKDLLPKRMKGMMVHPLSFRSGFWRLLWREQTLVPRLARLLDADVTFSPANMGPVFSRRTVVLLRNAPNVMFVERRLSKMVYWVLLYLATLLSVVASSKAIAVSDYAKRTICGGMFIWLRRKVDVVPHGVSPLFGPAERSAERDEFLLAVSDIYIQKNLMTLIRALSKLREDNPKLILKIAGYPVDAEYMKRVEDLISSLGLTDAVEFLGRRPANELVDLYRRCKVFVFPSLVETFGNPLVEAMACGAPIVTSNTAAMPEVVEEAACLFDPYDTADLVKTLGTLLESDDKRKKLSQLACARAKSFSWRSTAKKTATVLCAAKNG